MTERDVGEVLAMLSMIEGLGNRIRTIVDTPEEKTVTGECRHPKDRVVNATTMGSQEPAWLCTACGSESASPFPSTLED